jgi:hypothetical protein
MHGRQRGLGESSAVVPERVVQGGHPQAAGDEHDGGARRVAHVAVEEDGHARSPTALLSFFSALLCIEFFYLLAAFVECSLYTSLYASMQP